MVNLVPADASNVVKYWQNVLKHPISENPMDDDNGNRFDRAQGNSDVLFFAGNDAATHTRNISTPIPSNKRLFVAVNPVIITDYEVQNEPDKNLSSNAKKDEDTASRAILRIDGKEEFDLIAKGCRVPTGTFTVSFPPSGGRWGVSGGDHEAVADGYYAIIDKLEAGDHRLEIDAIVEKPFPFKQPVRWTSNVTYNFKVVGA